MASAHPNELVGPHVLDESVLHFNLQGPGIKVVVFLSAQCPCSKSHESLLKQLHADFPEVNFLGVHSNANESLSSSREHFLSAALPFPVLQDHSAHWADALGAVKTPHAYVFDAQGERVYSGGVSNSTHGPGASEFYLRNVLTQLRQGKSVDPKERRSLGCVIVRP